MIPGDRPARPHQDAIVFGVLLNLGRYLPPVGIHDLRLFGELGRNQPLAR
jgi:hypothetical protein